MKVIYNVWHCYAIRLKFGGKFYIIFYFIGSFISEMEWAPLTAYFKTLMTQL